MTETNSTFALEEQVKFEHEKLKERSTEILQQEIQIRHRALDALNERLSRHEVDIENAKNDSIAIRFDLDDCEKDLPRLRREHCTHRECFSQEYVVAPYSPQLFPTDIHTDPSMAFLGGAEHEDIIDRLSKNLSLWKECAEIEEIVAGIGRKERQIRTLEEELRIMEQERSVVGGDIKNSQEELGGKKQNWDAARKRQDRRVKLMGDYYRKGGPHFHITSSLQWGVRPEEQLLSVEADPFVDTAVAAAADVLSATGTNCHTRLDVSSYLNLYSVSSSFVSEYEKVLMLARILEWRATVKTIHAASQIAFEETKFSSTFDYIIRNVELLLRELETIAGVRRSRHALKITGLSTTFWRKRIRNYGIVSRISSN